jgi:hypothetical protein
MIAFLIIGFGLALMIWFIYNSKKEEKTYKQRQFEMAIAMDGGRADFGTMAQRAQALIQAELVGDHLTETSINACTYTGPLPERRDDGGWLSIYDNLRIFKIAGINYRQGISRYVGRVACALVPEPDNEYDPDAIKIVAEDRHHLGYIPSGQTEMVCWLAANEFPYRCTAFIEACEDETDGHKFFVGYVYIKRLD